VFEKGYAQGKRRALRGPKGKVAAKRAEGCLPFELAKISPIAIVSK